MLCGKVARMKGVVNTIKELHTTSQFSFDFFLGTVQQLKIGLVPPSRCWITVGIGYLIKDKDYGNDNATKQVRILLVKKGKILVLHAQHEFPCMLCRTQQNNVKSPNFSF